MGEPDRAEDARYELIQGETVMLAQPATPHAGIARNLSRIFGNYLRGKRCKVFGEVDVFLDERNHFVPDLVVVCDRDKIRYRGIFGAPDLVVEILSPATALRDRGVKKDAYERFGVREYWIVSPKGKSVEVYRLADGALRIDYIYHAYEPEEWDALGEDEKARERLALKVSLYDDLEIDVQEIFEE